MVSPLANDVVQKFKGARMSADGWRNVANTEAVSFRIHPKQANTLLDSAENVQSTPRSGGKGSAKGSARGGTKKRNKKLQ